MAPKRNAAGTATAPQTPVAPRLPPTNGVLTTESNPPAGVNRKKAKRRAKEAAKKTGRIEPLTPQLRHPSDFVEPARVNGQLPHRDGDTPLAYDPNEYYYPDSAEGGGAEEDYAYSDDDQYSYNEATQEYIREEERALPRRRSNGHAPNHRIPPSAPRHHGASNSHHTGPRPISDDALRTVQRGINSGTWNMSNIEERRQIKDYWLSLKENERKALVKIEKSDVLTKMKEQQKHSCSCTVCGRKRVAIEEELEILYDAYYKELEQYANHSQLNLDNRSNNILPPPPVRPTSRSPPPPRRKSPSRQRVPRGRVVEELPEEEEEPEDPSDEEEEEYSDDEYDEDYSEEEEDHLPPQAHEFFTFGNSLTVKGGILTVADDLLKNDGQKFIDMMEQLAERRMQREEQALHGPLPTHNPHPPQHSHGNHGNHAPHGNHTDHSHPHPPPEEEEFDDEEDEDYDSQEEDYDEEDDVDTMTETQRMEEGRRMFQIFAARMFEQRVLDAYRQKRAADRAALLIQEEAEEAARQNQSSEKSAKKNEKKRLKEKQKKQQLKEEKERKDAERAAAQAEEERRKQEEQRRKQEEAKKKQEAKAEEKRKKAEAARRTQEEEKAKKRAEELERKNKEQKAKEEKKQREEAERKEKEAQEKQLQQDREAKAEAERLEKSKAEQEAAVRRSTDQARPAEAARRAPIPAVALPPSLRTKSSAGLDSPQVKIATPVLPKAPAPVRPRELSSRTSQNSTPQTPEAVQAKQPTPPSQASSQPISQQSTASRARTPLPSATFTPQMSPMYNVAPPPGMSTPAQHLSHISPGGFPAMSSPMTTGMHRAPAGLQMPSYSPHTGSLGPQHRPFMPQNMAGPPPGIMPMGNGRQFSADSMPSPAPSFKTYPAGRSPGAAQGPSPGQENNQMHGRQPSMSSSAAFAPGMQRGLSISTQPIGKPNPIGRPQNEISFGRTRGPSSAVEDIGARLGSSALLDDSDEPEPLPTSTTDNRRVSAPFGMPSFTSQPSLGSSSYDQVHSPFGQSLPKDNGWRSSSSTFGPPGLTATSGWGGHAPAPAAGWGNPAPFPTTFVRPGTAPRPVSIRLLAVQSYRTLAISSPGVDGGFFDFNDIVRQATDMARVRGDKPPSRGEMENILDTEGDVHNGGGLFSMKEDKINRRVLVKWHPDTLDHSRAMRPGGGLGDIGSPLPGNIPGIRPRAF